MSLYHEEPDSEFKTRMLRAERVAHESLRNFERLLWVLREVAGSDAKAAADRADLVRMLDAGVQMMDDGERVRCEREIQQRLAELRAKDDAVVAEPLGAVITELFAMLRAERADPAARRPDDGSSGTVA